MSKNRVEGAFQNVAGKVQDAIGDLTDDARAQALGKARQVAGKVQGAYGKAADQAQDVAESVSEGVQRKPLVAVLMAGAVGYVLGRLTQRR